MLLMTVFIDFSNGVFYVFMCEIVIKKYIYYLLIYFEDSLEEETLSQWDFFWLNKGLINTYTFYSIYFIRFHYFFIYFFSLLQFSFS